MGEAITSDAVYSIPLRDMVGASVRREKTSHVASQGNNVGICQGITIYVYDHKTANRYKERSIFLPHPNDNICMLWVKTIQTFLAGKEHSSV